MKNILLLGGLAFGAYWLYKNPGRFKQVADETKVPLPGKEPDDRPTVGEILNEVTIPAWLDELFTKAKEVKPPQ